MARLSVPLAEPALECILRRIEDRMAALAATEPGLLERIAQQARQRALHLLGLTELQAELDAIALQRKTLDQRQRQAHRAMLAVVRRIPLEQASEGHGLRLPASVRKALAEAEAGCQEQLLAEHPVGREILRLRRERAQLLETLWLAGAPQPLQQLWQKVLELLGQEPTALQKAAVAVRAQDAPASTVSAVSSKEGS